MVYVTEVHMSPGGTRHEHIESVRWRNPIDATTGQSGVASMVQFIEANGPGSVRVEGPPVVNVGVNSRNGRKYIQTYADQTWTNNLLSLPRYTR